MRDRSRDIGHSPTLDSVVTDPADEQEAIAPTLDGAGASGRPAHAIVAAPVTHLGRFALLNQIGKGGMGSVFAAYDDQLDRRVAIKVLHQPLASSQLQWQQMLREARAVARISHPNVISVYEVGESDQHIYIAMEYVDGETLKEWQLRGGHTWQETLEMYLAAGAGLAFAHGVGVVHRDFKPDNVLIGKDGRVRVVDFGLARMDISGDLQDAALVGAAQSQSGDHSGQLTLSGAISGTPGYMSPEQYQGGSIDSRSDQWNFCVALFEALYGYKPFAGETLQERVAKLNGPPLPPPRDTRIPEEIHRVLLRGLHKDREQRFPSMTELLSALSLEQGDHAGGGKLSRNLFLRLMVVAAVVGMTIMQVRMSRYNVNMGRFALGTIPMLAVVVGLGIYWRRTLIGNRFHRSMWILCLLTVGQNLLQRAVAYKLGLSMAQLFPFEMIVLAATTAFAGFFLIPWFLWVPLVSLTVAALAISGWVPQRLLGLAYPLMLGALAYGWTHADTLLKRSAGGKDSLIKPLLRPRSKASASSQLSAAASRSSSSKTSQ